jgi:hypothetical protein
VLNEEQAKLLCKIFRLAGRKSCEQLMTLFPERLVYKIIFFDKVFSSPSSRRFNHFVII